MVTKTDHAPAPIGQRPVKHSRKIRPANSRQAALTIIVDAGLAFSTLFAVFSGVTGPQENLEEMGVYPGPTHL